MPTVYEVPADAIRGPVTPLSPDAVAALDSRVHSLDDVRVVASLLANVPKFPLDMIDQVLQFADFVLTFEATTHEVCYGRSDMNEVYLELQLPCAHELDLPPGVTVEPDCVELTVECASHDQGWASQENEYDGTYEASFTWSEVAVVKPADENGDLATFWQPVTANVRARSAFRHHFKRFYDPNGFASRIALGDTIQLVLRSQYPGWANSANFGRLRARFRVGICGDAELRSLQQLAHRRIPTTVTKTATRTTLNHCILQ